MAEPKPKALPETEAANDDVETYIFVKSFWHKAAGRRIYAPPGRAFRIPIRSTGSVAKK